MHRREPHDVIVVGARAAGAATAMLLARAGLRTLLVDDGDPGSHPPPTHALTRGGVRSWPVGDCSTTIVAAGTPPLRRTTLRYGDETMVISVKPSHGVDALYAPRPSRPRSAAGADGGGRRRRGATTHSSVTDLLIRDGRVCGVRARRRTGIASTSGSQLVIGADGIRSTVARRVGATFSRVGHHAAAMTYGVLVRS